jgi:hypothetical protein
VAIAPELSVSGSFLASNKVANFLKLGFIPKAYSAALA